MSTLTSSPPSTAATGGDRLRQGGVTLAYVLCVVGFLVGTGVLGTEVSESSGGALDDDATLLAPDGPAFSIWSVIYAGLLAYTIWQWLPAQTTSSRHRAIGWWAAASMVLNAAWLFVIQTDILWLSVAVIVALLVTVIRIVMLLEAHPREGIGEGLVSDGTFGLYLGWTSVAVCPNIAAALGSAGLRPEGAAEEALAVAVIAAVALIGVALAFRFGTRIAVALAIAWGLGWITYGRIAGEPESLVTAVAAGLAAVVVLAATAIARTRRTA